MRKSSTNCVLPLSMGSFLSHSHYIITTILSIILLLFGRACLDAYHTEMTTDKDHRKTK